MESKKNDNEIDLEETETEILCYQPVRRRITDEDSTLIDMDHLETNHVEEAPAAEAEREPTQQEQEIIQHLRTLRQACGEQYSQILRNECQGLGIPQAQSTPRPPQTGNPAPAPGNPVPLQPAQQPIILRMQRDKMYADIPIFEGRQPGLEGYVSVEVFLRAIRQETSEGQWSDREKILLARQHMRGSARSRFDNRNLASLPTWIEFEAQMNLLYGLSDDERAAHLYLFVPYRKTGEQLASYIDRVANELNNYAKSGEMQEMEKTNHLRRIFKVTLPEELRVPLLTKHTYTAMVKGILAYAEACPAVRLRPRDISKEDEIGTNRRTVATAAVSNLENAITSPTTTPTVAATAQATRNNDKDATWAQRGCQICRTTSHWTVQCYKLQSGLQNGNKNFSAPQPNFSAPPRPNVNRNGPPTYPTNIQQRPSYIRSPYPSSGYSGSYQGYQGYQTAGGAPPRPCAGCGGAHPRSTCTRSHTVTCSSCGIVGHFQSVCRKKNGNRAANVAAPPIVPPARPSSNPFPWGQGASYPRAGSAPQQLQQMSSPLQTTQQQRYPQQQPAQQQQLRQTQQQQLQQ